MSIRRFIAAVTVVAVVLAAGGFAPAKDEPDLPEGLTETPDEPDLPDGLGDDEPDLPDGLGDDDPDLPDGLGDDDEPDLPDGLDDADKTDDGKTPPDDDRTLLQKLGGMGVNGFVEVRGGLRTQADRHEDDASIGEMRLQLQWERSFQHVTIKTTGDLLYDPVDDRLHKVDLVRGTGWFDLRELSGRFSPADWMDVKVGRQALTWGTGDLVFLNDLFPKDWQSYFTGRDLEYLKAPVDAAKVSLFSKAANVDLVFMPRFNPSRFISGRRLSYYSPTMGKRAGQNAVIKTDLPNEWFDDSQWAARVSRRVGSYELAGYGYWGLWRTPEGFDPVRGRATYPRLSTYGASVRGPLGRGIANAEAAYYDSRQDRSGSDPMVRNSETRLLGGYETDLPAIAPELTAALQYYVELMQDYNAYRRTLPAGAKARDRDRHVLTVRLTKQLFNQNLTLGVFTYYSPSDQDAYIRPNAKYKIDDHWTAEVGGNVFVGKDAHTFFGQFERNSNLYAALRYAF